MATFKVGDRVKIRGNESGHGFPIGTEGIVKKIPEQGENTYKVAYLDDHDYWYVKPSDMRLTGKKELSQEILTVDEYTVKICKNGKTAYEQSFPELDIAKLVIGLNDPYQAKVGLTMKVEAPVKKPAARKK